MTRGRKPKPTTLKKQQGNPGKRKLNNKEPKPEVAIPDCPPHLEGEAKKEWDRITKELHLMGLLSRADRAALVSYCTAWGDYVKACNNIEDEGEVIMGAKGGYYQNPWVSIKNSAMDRMLKISAEFGMTPSSRTRLQVEAPTEEDDMQAMLTRKRDKVTKQ